MAKQRLETRLLLLDWLYSQLGLDLKRLQELLKACNVGLAANGMSCYAATLAYQTAELKLTNTDLAQYDLNIRTALARINSQRSTPLELKYYQYCAALLVEILLHRRQDRAQLLTELNLYRDQRNRRLPASDYFTGFVDSDLDKVALWMATGSGKTLLMHLNYHQYLHYNPQPENIVLITPNEGLSEQHLEEWNASATPAERWRSAGSGTVPLRDPATVLIIEITKLTTSAAKSGGASASVGQWNRPNLVFVDEGHRGSGGDVWKTVRDTLGAGGFTFEYSATFGQAVHAAGGKLKANLIDEYSKAIVFDYSYKYFYNDNYGKDYSIFNLPDGWDERLNERMLLANLLQFYQQCRTFDLHRLALKPYNLEAPLWIFVGSSVNAVSKSSGGTSSDVLDAVLFIDRVLNNPTNTIHQIERIISGQSELRIDGFDIFANQFTDLGLDAASIYADLVKRVFHAPQSAPLRLVDRTQTDGEIALHAGSHDQPFGVINIGDTPSFLNLVADRAPSIVQSVDRFGGSVFGTINRPQSSINLLIGAKKFTEGWNSWRVSTMTLLNVGKSEGSQIIQLFGRGVRLRGEKHSLQRSAAIAPSHLATPLQQLETLAVFGLRANYMDTFAEYLQRETIQAEPLHEIVVPTKATKHAALLNQLTVPTLDHRTSFKQQRRLALFPDRSLNPIKLNVSQTLQSLSSRAPQIRGMAQLDRPFTLPESSQALLDWSALQSALQTHQREQGYSNLRVSEAGLREILADPYTYTLIGNPSIATVTAPDDLARVQTLAQRIVIDYMNYFYKQHRLRWEGQHLHYVTIDTIADVMPDHYSVWVRDSQRQFISDLKYLITSDDLYTRQPANIPTLFLAEHLYQPLFTEGSAELEKTVPVMLNSGERTFAEDLRTFIGSIALPADWQIVVLRNLSKGKGVYFWQTAGFYPDFILWLLTPTKHHVIFIDPKGLRNLLGQFNDEKVTLHTRIKAIETALQPTSGPTIQLDAFLDSTTSMADVPWQVERPGIPAHDATLNDYHKNHIFFQSEGPGRFLTMLANIGVNL